MPTDEYLKAARDERHKAHKLLKAGDYEGAISAFTEAISLNPDAMGAYNKRAKAYRHLGREEEAESDFEMVRALERKRKLEREAARQASPAERKRKRRLGRETIWSRENLLPVLIPVAVLLALILVAVSYGKARVGSQSDLPDYTVVAKKHNCWAPSGAAEIICTSYNVKLVLNGRVKEYWLSESDEECYGAAHDGAILRASCRERLRIKGSPNQFHIPQ